MRLRKSGVKDKLKNIRKRGDIFDAGKRQGTGTGAFAALKNVMVPHQDEKWKKPGSTVFCGCRFWKFLSQSTWSLYAKFVIYPLLSCVSQDDTGEN